MTLCRCGCGLPAPIAPFTYAKRGMVKGEPRPFRHGHHPRKDVHRYHVDDLTGCWIWYAWRHPLGYGKLLLRSGKVALAHRYFYELTRGPIPPELELDHLCRRPSCVNPDHMEAVTHAENTRRGDKSRLNSEAAKVIRALYGRVPVWRLAAVYGISSGTASNVAKGHGGAWL